MWRLSVTSRRYLLPGYAVLPVVGDPFTAMSVERQLAMIGGLDPTTVLEAASVVTAEIENDRHDQVRRRLALNDQRSLARWEMARANRRNGEARAAGPLHALAVLAATNLAMSQARPGSRSDRERDEAAARICQVATQYNQAAVQGDAATDDDGLLAAMSMTVLWKSMLDEAWTVWSAELITAVAEDPAAADVLDSFEGESGLSLLEWHARTLGERATRRVQGAGSFGHTEKVDPDLEAAWLATVGITPREVVQGVAGLIDTDRRGRPRGLADPAALGWLATRPIVVRDDAARWALWLGGLDYALLPATIATRVSDATGIPLDRTSAIMGVSAGTLLTAHIESFPLVDEQRTPESEMPSKQPKCDYMLETADALVGIEFTVARPPASLATGRVAGLGRLVPSLAAKMRQAYRTMNRVDPSDLKRKLPLVVFGSPNVVDPLVNLRVHDLLVNEGLTEGEPELMTCHAPEFHDLVQFAADRGMSLTAAIVNWRDSRYGGANLDWWLADKGALGLSTRQRLEGAMALIEPVLTRKRR